MCRLVLVSAVAAVSNMLVTRDLLNLEHVQAVHSSLYSELQLDSCPSSRSKQTSLKLLTGSLTGSLHEW